MARPLRIEFAGAIYHVLSRGNAREGIFDDGRDDARLRDGLAQTVTRYDWELLTFVFVPNHVHLFLRTPQPNLSRSMQYLLSRVRELVRETTPAAWASVSRSVQGQMPAEASGWIGCRLTTATLRELASLFGLSHPGSVCNLLRRAERAVAESSRLRRVIEVIEQRLIKTKNEVRPLHLGKRGLPPAGLTPARFGGTPVEMPVVRHEHPSEDTPAASDYHPNEQLEPALTIGIIAHHHTPLPAAACQVRRSVLDVDSQKAVDVTIPGGSPIQVRAAGSGSAFQTRLGPGECAVIYLGCAGPSTF